MFDEIWEGFFLTTQFNDLYDSYKFVCGPNSPVSLLGHLAPQLGE